MINNYYNATKKDKDFMKKAKDCINRYIEFILNDAPYSYRWYGQGIEIFKKDEEIGIIYLEE